MNQDALENFFGCVRSCQNSSSLIAMHFRAAYGTTFIKNLTSAHSIKSNCEADTSTPLITNLRKFFLNYDNVDTPDSNENDSDDDEDDERYNDDVFDPLHNFSVADVNFISSEAIANASGSICEKMLKITKCINCRKTLEMPWKKNDKSVSETLKQPSDLLKNNFQKLVHGINDVLPNICVEKCLKRKLLEQLEKIELDAIGCEEHDEVVGRNLKKQTALYGIVTFTKNVNDLLSGKNITLPPNYNYLEELAHIFNKKKKRIGKQSDILQD